MWPPPNLNPLASKNKDFGFQKTRFQTKLIFMRLRFLNKISDYFEVARKTEGRVASDTDLKLSDTLRYYMRDSKAALDLLYRRTRRLYDFETENKNLEKARLKKKDEKQAESNQQIAKQKFEQISDVARTGWVLNLLKIILLIKCKKLLFFCFFNRIS